MKIETFFESGGAATVFSQPKLGGVSEYRHGENKERYEEKNGGEKTNLSFDGKHFVKPGLLR
jgi:hypothetical protein